MQKKKINVSETLDRESGRPERKERTQTNPPWFYPRFPVGSFSTLRSGVCLYAKKKNNVK